MNFIFSGYVVTMPRRLPSGDSSQICVSLTNSETFQTGDQVIADIKSYTFNQTKSFASQTRKFTQGNDDTGNI